MGESACTTPIDADCLSVIFSYLPFSQLTRLVPVCKWFQYLIMTNGCLWEQVDFTFSNLNGAQKWFDLCDDLDVPVHFLNRVIVENLQLVNVEPRLLDNMNKQLVELSLHSVYLNNYSFLITVLRQCPTLKRLTMCNISGSGPLKNLGNIAGAIQSVEVSGVLSHSLLDLMNWILLKCQSSITSISVDSMNIPSAVFTVENLDSLKLPASALQPILQELFKKRLKTLQLTDQRHYNRDPLQDHSEEGTQFFNHLKNIMLDMNASIQMVRWCIDAFETRGRDFHFAFDKHGNLGLDTEASHSKNIIIPRAFCHNKPLHDQLFSRIITDTLSKHTTRLTLNNLRLENDLMNHVSLHCTHLRYLNASSFDMNLREFADIVAGASCRSSLSTIQVTTSAQSLLPDISDYERLKCLPHVSELAITCHNLDQRLGGDNAWFIFKCFPCLVSLTLDAGEEYWQRNMITENQLSDSNNWIEIFTNLYSTTTNYESRLKEINLYGRFNTPSRITFCPAVQSRHIEYVGTWRTEIVLNLAFPKSAAITTQVNAMMENWRLRLKWIAEHFQDRFVIDNLETIVESILTIKKIYLIERNIDNYPASLMQDLRDRVIEDFVNKAIDLVARAMDIEYKYYNVPKEVKKTRKLSNSSYTQMMSIGAQMMTIGSTDYSKRGLSYKKMIAIGSSGTHSLMRQLNEAEKYFSRATSRNQNYVDSMVPFAMVANKAWKRVSSSAYELDRQVRRTQRRTSRANIFKFWVFFCFMCALLATWYHY